MDEMTNDDDEKVETSEERHADGIGGDDASLPEEPEVLGDDAAAAAGATPRPVSETNGSTAPPDTSPGTENEERLTKAKLIELGRRFVRIQKENRRKAKARADQEKAKGLLTITLKSHKDHRRLVMAVGKELIITLDRMREANLNTGPLEDSLTRFLEDYNKTHVGPQLKNKKP